MLPEDVELEMERLKEKKIEVANKINLTTDFEEKEELKKELERIQMQIDTLEKFKTKF
jgi:hypothetical protein